jgi:2Fe-2S ferredoxin
MVNVTYITFDGQETVVDVADGMTLMEGAIQNGVDGIEAVCGGNCYCGTCRIYLTADWLAKLAPPEQDELDMIEAAGETDESARLSCQIKVSNDLDGIVVRTPEFQK